MNVLNGLSILLVEDEWLIALDAGEMLSELGARVTTCASLEEGAAAAASGAFDAAVLDVNLGGKLSFPIGALLAERGVPLIYASGYNLVERPLDGFKGGRWIGKPYTKASLHRALVAALSQDYNEASCESPVPSRSHDSHAM